MAWNSPSWPAWLTGAIALLLPFSCVSIQWLESLVAPHRKARFKLLQYLDRRDRADSSD